MSLSDDAYNCCPFCGGQGYTVVTDSYGEPEQEQCRFCYETAYPLSKRIAELEAQLAEKNEYIIQLECAVNNLQQNTITAMSERDTLADDCSKLEAQLAKLEAEIQRLQDALDAISNYDFDITDPCDTATAIIELMAIAEKALEKET